MQPGGDNTSRESQRNEVGTVYRVIRNRLSRRQRSRSLRFIYSSLPPRSTVLGAVKRFDGLFFAFLHFSQHSHSLSASSSFSGFFSCHLSRPPPSESSAGFYVKLIFLRFYVEFHHSHTHTPSYYNFALLYLTKYLLAFGGQTFCFFISTRVAMMGITAGGIRSLGKAPRDFPPLLLCRYTV